MNVAIDVYEQQNWSTQSYDVLLWNTQSKSWVLQNDRRCAKSLLAR